MHPQHIYRNSPCERDHEIVQPVTFSVGQRHVSGSIDSERSSASKATSRRLSGLRGVEEMCPGIASQPLHPSSASMSRSSSARFSTATPDSRGMPGMSPCIVSQPLHPSMASSSQPSLEQEEKTINRSKGSARRQLPKTMPFGTDADLLPWQRGEGVRSSVDFGATVWSKRGKLSKKQYKETIRTLTTVDNVISRGDEPASSDEEDARETYRDLAGLPSWLSRANRRIARLNQFKQQSMEAASVRGTTPEEQSPTSSHHQDIHANLRARLYQSSVGALISGAPPDDLVDDSVYIGSAGKPTWAAEVPRNKKCLDYSQMETIDTQCEPKPRGTRRYESQERETSLLFDGGTNRDELRAKRAEKEFSRLHEGSAGNRTWFEPPQKMQRDFSKAPNVKSVVDIVVFGRDQDLEGDTPWSTDFTDMFDGLAGLPTWTPEDRRALRRVDHSSNHFYYESDPYGKEVKIPTGKPKSATTDRVQPVMQHITQDALVGCAGFPYWERTQRTYHQGPRKILAPAVLNETLCMEEDHTPRDPPKEWASSRFAGTRSWEKRPKEDMEIRADNAQKFGKWTDNRPSWKRVRHARSNPPRQSSLSRSHGDGTKKAFVRNRSASPRSARALAGG